MNVCEICKVADDGAVYWRHPELYHVLTDEIGKAANWYGSGTGSDEDILAMSFQADVRRCEGRMLCQDCRKPYEEAALRREKISKKNAKLESAGQKRLPGW